MFITVKKNKHNKIDKGGEGEEGGFKPEYVTFLCNKIRFINTESVVSSLKISHLSRGS